MKSAWGAKKWANSIIGTARSPRRHAARGDLILSRTLALPVLPVSMHLPSLSPGKRFTLPRPIG